MSFNRQGRCNLAQRSITSKNDRTPRWVPSPFFSFLKPWWFEFVAIKHKENLWSDLPHNESPEEQHGLLNRLVPAEIFKLEIGSSDKSTWKVTRKSSYSQWFRNCFKLVRGPRRIYHSFQIELRQQNVSEKWRNAATRRHGGKHVTVGQGRYHLQVWGPVRSWLPLRGEDENNKK